MKTMNQRLSKRAIEIKPSSTIIVSTKAKEMKAKGIDVINFGVGEPDFNTPDIIKEAAKKAIDANFTHYTQAAGIPELRKAICNKLKKDNSLDYSPEQIVVSVGGKGALFNALFAICGNEDEVIVPAPYWVTYPEQIKLCNASPVIMQTSEKNNFKIIAKELENLIKSSKKIKALILNSPCNPTGTVYTKKELEEIAKICVAKDILVISDEIYEKLVYDCEHYSIASFPGMIDRTIIINGVSKSYAMTGWRIGYSAGPKDIMAKISSIQSQLTSNICSIGQKAALAAYSEEISEVETMRKEFEKRKDYIVKTLKSMKEINCNMPEGAFYVFPNVSSYLDKNDKIKTDLDLCNYLLEIYHIALVPGSAFGMNGYVRFSYATSMDNIKEGLKRFEKGLKSLL